MVTSDLFQCNRQDFIWQPDSRTPYARRRSLCAPQHGSLSPACGARFPARRVSRPARRVPWSDRSRRGCSPLSCRRATRCPAAGTVPTAPVCSWWLFLIWSWLNLFSFYKVNVFIRDCQIKSWLLQLIHLTKATHSIVRQHSTPSIFPVTM